MREIKFRAWDKKRKEWYGKSNPQHSLLFYGFSVFGECTLLSPPACDDLQHLEIEQYTGLKDKNGKEIYEGDIVRGQYECDGWNSYKHFTSEIKFEDGGYCVEVEKDYSPYIVEYELYLEVIGNIHENPEQLKEK